MPRPRRCQPREGEYHDWILDFDRFVCVRCREPGPDLNDALLFMWEAGAQRARSIEDKYELLQAQVERAHGVLQCFEDAAAVMEAELAAEGRRPPAARPVRGIAPSARCASWLLVINYPGLPRPGVAGFQSEADLLSFVEINYPEATHHGPRLTPLPGGRERRIVMISPPPGAPPGPFVPGFREAVGEEASGGAATEL